MDQSTLRLPDPKPGVPNEERRRSVRQKLHTPVYASFNGPEAGMVVDLSELLDLHEGGFAVQTSEPLEVNRALTFCLDLPETRNFIHGTGQVIWSDDSGRGGVRFSSLPEASRKVLKEWLFANLLIASSNHAARTEQLARHKREQEQGQEQEQEQRQQPQPPVQPQAAQQPSVQQQPVQQQQEQPREEQRHEQPHEQPQQHGQQLQPERERPEPPPIPKTHTVVTVSNKTGVPASVELLRDEVREMGEDADAIFQLITERAAIVTGAGGAALALLTGDRMIWRARSGDPAPPRGAPVDIKQGLSAECVRTGLLVSSQDLGNDSRVDPKIGRAVGIGSLIAAPIVSDFRVVGLLEVFSPYPRSFTRAHGKILERLVEVIPQAHRGVAAGQSDASFRLQSASNGIFPAADPWAANNEFDERAWHRSELAVSEQLLAPASKASGGASRFFHLGLLGLAIMVVFVVLGYMVGPLIEKHWAASSSVPESLIKGAQAAGAVLVPASVRPLPAKSLEELERLANRGDADAQWQMAVRYHDGEGVPQSDTQAMLWFQLAAEQGNVAAQSALGSYYWAGRGVPEDLSKAYMWSAIALAGGDANSKARLEGLASRMTHAQVSAARQLAEVWLRSHRQRSKSEAN